MENYTIGLDYGTDSVRAVLVDASDGKVHAEAVRNYPRWSEGRYCDSSTQMFRHHPLDYLESLKGVLHDLLDSRPGMAAQVRGIGVDCTAATPCLVDDTLMPLAMRPEFFENPDAMFVLWKDHSGAAEALEIEARAGEYLAATSGTYSPECYWAKLLHVLRSTPSLAAHAHQFLELCDWIPALLCGNTDPSRAKISQGVVATKMLYNPALGGLPPREWFASVDECWLRVYDNTHPGNNTCDKVYGHLCAAYAEEFGMSTDVAVACGMVDSFCGAIGSGITPERPIMTLGTSSGYMTVSPAEKSTPVRGAFSQGEGFVLPGMFSVEMGLSAFGDAYAWLARLLAWLPGRGGVRMSNGEVLAALAEDAAMLPLNDNAPFATDFFNGRRSPDQNPDMWASLMGLKLTTSAPELYRAIVEATCFATRAIIERLAECGLDPAEVMCIGGISQKAPYVMQMMADVCGKPMKVYDNGQTCALGAAMIGAAAAGLYSDVTAAQTAMMAGVKATYNPDASRRGYYDRRYARYKAATAFTEQLCK